MKSRHVLGRQRRLGRLLRKVRRISSGMRKALMTLGLGIGPASSLWAEPVNRLRYLQQEFQRRQSGAGTAGTQLKWVILAFIIGVAVIGAVYWLVERFRHRRPYYSRFLLFLELCWVHRLSVKEIWHLWRWAHRSGIRPMARVFTEPELWDGYVNFAAHAAGLATCVTLWDKLYARCFGELAVGDPLPAENAGQEQTTSVTSPAQAPAGPSS